MFGGKNRRGSRVLLGVAVAMAMLVSSVASNASADTESSSDDPSDSVAPLFTPGTYPRVDGSTVTQPLGVAFQSLFTGQDVNSSQVVFNQTHQAYLNLINGDTDLILVTSPSQDELDAAAAAGMELEVIPVVDEGFVFLTNADNPVDSLTQDQVRAIYSGQIANWKDVGGPDQPITAYQRPENSGSQTGMLDLVMGDTPMMVAPTVWTVGSMGALLSAITATFNGNSGSLGYSYYYYVTQMYGDLAVNPQLSKIKLMSIDGVQPTADTIRSGQYPLHTAYYIVINKADATDSPARILANAMLGHDGQQTAMEAGYVPIDESIPLPTPPAPDPNGLTSLDEKYPVNPLWFSYSTEALQGPGGCTTVQRVTVFGLEDTDVQDQINARFRAIQDSVGGFGADPATCDAMGTYGGYTLTGVVGANFSNVLSLQTDLMTPLGPGLGGSVADGALNVRLDTGEDLTPADVFTTTANVPGMIQLEAQASNVACDEACANAKADAYRADPDQPFRFTAQSATIAGVAIPFTSYWPQVAIFTKYASLTGIYPFASPASCPVVTTAWNDSIGACVAVSPTVADFGTQEISSDADTLSVHIPAASDESWELAAMPCADMLNGTTYYYNPVIPSDNGKLESGVGPDDISVPVVPNATSTGRTVTVCVQAINQTTRMARFGEITIVQDAIAPTWTVTLDPSTAVVTRGNPIVSGTLTTSDGTGVGGTYVSVTVTDVRYGSTSPSCSATTNQDGTWSCRIDPALTSGVHHIQARAGSCISDQCEWGVTTGTLTVLADGPAAPQITSPLMGQTIFTLPQYYYVGSAYWVEFTGTAVPGATVAIYDADYTMGTATVDENGHWSAMVNGTTGLQTLAVDATVDGTRSEATPVAFTIDSSLGYSVRAPEESVVDGVDQVAVTVDVVDARGESYTGSMPGVLTATAEDPAVQVLTDSAQFVNGSAVMRFSSAQSGAYSVQLLVDGQPVPTPPYPGEPTLTTVSFTHGTQPLMAFEVTPQESLPLSVVADGVDSWIGTVTMRHPDGTPVIGASIPMWHTQNVNHLGTGAVKLSDWTDNGDGTYTMTITSQYAGTYLLTPMAQDGTWATAIAQQVNFISGPCGETSCMVATLAYDAMVVDPGEPVTATVTVLDAYGSWQSGVDVHFSANDSDVRLSSDSCTTNYNYCSITATLDRDGTYLLSATVDGGQPAESPGAIRVYAAPDVSTSSFSVESAGLAVGTTGTATVTVRDASGNPVSNTPVWLIADSSSVVFYPGSDLANRCAEMACVRVWPDIDGQVTIPFQSQSIQSVNLTAGLEMNSDTAITVDNVRITPIGDPIRVIWAPVSIAMPSLGTIRAEAGSEDQPINGVTIDFTVDGDAIQLSADSCVTGQVTGGEPQGVPPVPGYCTVSFATVRSGQAVIHAYSAGVEVDGSPVTLTITGAEPPAPTVSQANASVISGHADSTPGVASNDIVNVEIMYPVAGGTTKTVTAEVDSNGDWSMATPNDAVDGQISVVSVASSGARSDATTAHLGMTVIVTLEDWYDAIQMLPGGAIGTAIVSARDGSGAPVDGVVVTFSADGDAMSLDAPSCTTGVGAIRDGDTLSPPRPGYCSVSYGAVHPGEATMHASYNGVELNDSPWTVRVYPANMEDSLEITRSARVGDTWQVTLTGWAYDENGEGTAGVEMRFSADDDWVRLSQSSCVTGPDGSCFITASATRSGSSLIHAYANGSELYYSPAGIVFNPETACADLADTTIRCGAGFIMGSASEVGSEGDTVPVDTSVAVTTLLYQHTLWPIVTDPGLVDLEGARITFLLTGQYETTTTECVTDRFGDCNIPVTSQVPGDVTIRAFLGDWELTATPLKITFVDDPQPEPSWFRVAPATGTEVPADGTSAWTGTITLIDSEEGPVTNAQPSYFGFILPDEVSVSPVVNNGDGTYTVQFTSEVPGQYPVTAYALTVGWFGMVNAHANLTFTEPNPVAPPAPTVVTANGTVIAGHADPTPGSVVANDIVRVEITYPVAGGSTKTVTAGIGSGGDWSVATPSDAVDGQMSVVSVNAAGVSSDPGEAPLDVTPPEAPSVAVADTIQISGTAEAGSWIRTTGAVTAETTADLDGVWLIFTPTTAVPGEIRVTATDRAGNMSQATMVSLEKAIVPPDENIVPPDENVVPPDENPVLPGGDIQISTGGASSPVTPLICLMGMLAVGILAYALRKHIV